MTNNTFAMVFPGQGSQYQGMLNELSTHHSIVGHTFEEASEVLGYDVWKICQENPENQLNETMYTQPALLTAEVALYRIWRKWQGPEPTYMAGHSLGEYAALVCAGAMAFEVAVSLVAQRGAHMQSAVPVGKGAMAAIVGLDNKSVVELCEECAEEQVLMPANYNSYGQVVIAGETEAVERAVKQAEVKGAILAKLLPVSVPSHCALMQPASELLAKGLGEIVIQSPKISVVNNVDVAVVTEPSFIKDALVRQLAHPVRWVEVIEYLLSKEVCCFVECGPGKVLQGLNRRITKDIKTISLQSAEDFEQAFAMLKSE